MEESEETLPLLPHHHVLLRIADGFWSCLVVYPLCVVYWSSTWKLMDTYVLPNSVWGSGCVSLAIGVVLGFLAYIVLPLMKRCVRPGFSVRHVILSRIYLYIHNFAILNFWRGVWHLMDNYATAHWKPSLICFCIAIALLIVSRSSNNCSTTPFHLAVDNRSDFYRPKPRFRTSLETHRPAAFLLDCVFSHLFITHLCIQVWRGLWNFFDTFLYPGPEPLLSYYVSLGLGYGTWVIFFSLQYPLQHLAKRLHSKHPMLELIFEDIMTVFIVIGTLLIWRGGWGIFKDYVLMEVWHLWVCHVIGWTSLAALQIASTIDVAGVSIDAELGHGKGMLLDLHYFLTLCTWWRMRSTDQMLINEDADSEDPYFSDPYGDESWGQSRPVNYSPGIN